MNRILLFIILSFTIVFLFSEEKIENSFFENPPTLNEAIRQSLSLIKMTPADVQLQADYVKKDTFRLCAVIHLLENPLETIEFSNLMAKEIEDSSKTLLERFCIMSKYLDIEIDPQKSEIRINSFENVINILKNKMFVAAKMKEELLSEFTIAELDTLFENIPLLLQEDEEITEKTIFELAEIEKEARKFSEKLYEKFERFDRKIILNQGYFCLQGIEEITEYFTNLAPAEIEKYNKKGFFKSIFRKSPKPETSTGNFLYYEQTPWGDIVIGGSGENHYSDEFAIIIDLEGNDTYSQNAGGTMGKFPFALCLDLKGDDKYFSGSFAAFGTGLFGCGILIDEEGDDYYSTVETNLGTGWVGTGILLDKKGSDKYFSDFSSQGAAFLGIGLQIDESGNDIYQGTIFCQGFGYLAGFGALLDRTGNDFYLVQQKYTDLLRYNDHAVSLSQGFGFGHRPDYSGGIGLLDDISGNDTYVSDIYGQGSSYWYSLGFLVDRDGHDNYNSYQYSQGAGIHISVGGLLDENGNDNYSANGVSQGEGHDLGVGYLLDIKGNDDYVCYDLSQGAASHHGVGTLADLSGNDGYLSKNAYTTHGHGRMSRNYGSIGLILDLQGTDFYTAKGEDKDFWISSTYGAGIDYPIEIQEEEIWDYGEKDSVEVRDYTTEELFIMASAYEPKFSLMREFGNEEILKDPEETCKYLISISDTKNAPEVHSILAIFKNMGEEAVPFLIEALNDSVRAKVGLFVISLGDIGDERAIEPLIELSQKKKWNQSGAMVRSLGKFDDERCRKRIHEISISEFASEKENELLRKDLIVALKNIDAENSIELFITALQDSFYVVRYPAKDALVFLKEKAFEPLKEFLSSTEDTLATCLAIEALEEIQDKRVVPVLMGLQDSDLWNYQTVRFFVINALKNLDENEKAQLLLNEEDERNWFLQKLKDR